MTNHNSSGAFVENLFIIDGNGTTAFPLVNIDGVDGVVGPWTMTLRVIAESW